MTQAKEKFLGEWIGSKGEITMTQMDKDPNGKDAHEGGAKLDSGKLRLHLLFKQYFPNAIIGVTQVSEFGASKYSPGGWETVPDGYQRYSDAMERHSIQSASGEVLDKDSGLPHDFHLAWNALARIEFGMKEGMYNENTDSE